MGTMYMKFKTSLNAMVIISNARFARICAIARPLRGFNFLQIVSSAEHSKAIIALHKLAKVVDTFIHNWLYVVLFVDRFV